MLKLKNIYKSFHQRGLVLNNLCIEVKEGDSIAISGPSGSGKTTLMNIIGLLDKPDSGEIIFRNASLMQLSANESAYYRNQNVGFVFQDHLLLPHLTVLENILLPALALPQYRQRIAEKKNYIMEMMVKMGISELSKKFPFQISGGEAQRVTLVRAVVNRPAILLADEPTGSLDTLNAKILGDLLIEMNKESGVTLIVATHSADLADKMTIRLELENGILLQR